MLTHVRTLLLAAALCSFAPASAEHAHGRSGACTYSDQPEPVRDTPNQARLFQASRQAIQP